MPSRVRLNAKLGCTAEGSERNCHWLDLTGKTTQPLRKLKVAELVGL